MWVSIGESESLVVFQHVSLLSRKALVGALATSQVVLCAGVSTAEAATSHENEVVSAHGDSSNMDWVCDLSGQREPNTWVTIGVGDSRHYRAYVNEYGQLSSVWAEKIKPQDDAHEDVTKDGRYCNSQADVPGVGVGDFERGHAIADSLGGVSNAYNITPQNRELNRQGKQHQMEQDILNAGGAFDFHMSIFYPDAETMIPSGYDVTYYFKTTDNREIQRSWRYANTAQGEPQFPYVFQDKYYDADEGFNSLYDGGPLSLSGTPDDLVYEESDSQGDTSLSREELHALKKKDNPALRQRQRDELHKQKMQMRQQEKREVDDAESKSTESEVNEENKSEDVLPVTGINLVTALGIMSISLVIAVSCAMYSRRYKKN